MCFEFSLHIFQPSLLSIKSARCIFMVHKYIII